MKSRRHPRRKPFKSDLSHLATGVSSGQITGQGRLWLFASGFVRIILLEQSALMNAKEFNSQVDSVLAPILAEAGFRKLGSHFVREHDSSQLVLFRFAGSQFASLCQFTKYMLCFRHTFLRDVWEKIPDSHPKEPSGFPFRIKSSDLSSGDWRHWIYQFQLSAVEHDTIDFGDLDDARQILRRMGEAVV
jgi:hypothetical protein